jgi:hypothetical protein
MTTKINFLIEDPNGNADGTSSANDSTKVEILRKQGESGTWASVHEVPSLQAGRRSYSYSDDNLADSTPYYYKTRTTRGTEVIESPVEVGPIFGKSLNNLAYPNNAPSYTDGTPYRISVEPLQHYSASDQVNQVGGDKVSDHTINSGQFSGNLTDPAGRIGNAGSIINQANSYDGWSAKGTDYMYLCHDTTLDVDFYHYYGSALPVKSGSEAFGKFTTNIGTDITPYSVALNEGFISVLVLPYWCGNRPTFRDYYSSPYVFLNTGTHLPSEWATGYSTSDRQYDMTKRGRYFNPRRFSDGQWYTNSNVTYDGVTYYGSPNGVTWPEFPGFYGSGAGVANSYGSHKLDYNVGIGQLFTARNREDFDEFFVNDTNTYNPPEGGESFPDQGKLSVFVARWKEDGSGAKFYTNGNLMHSTLHQQSTAIQNAGGHDSNWAVEQTGVEHSQDWWAANGHCTTLTALNGESDLGYVYHVPPLVTDSFSGLWTYNSSTLHFCESIFIPSALPDNEFATLIDYIEAKYSGKLNTQSNYPTS